MNDVHTVPVRLITACHVDYGTLLITERDVVLYEHDDDQSGVVLNAIVNACGQ